MRKPLCVVLAFFMMLCLTGCSTKDGDIQNPVSFYYLQAEMEYGTDPSVIGKEIRDAAGRQTDYAYLLELYLQGPESYTLYSPFSSRTTLVSLELQDDTAFVQLNYSFAGLTGMDLSLACACITITVCEMTGMRQAVISVPGATLDGNPSITMSSDSILLLDNSNIVIDPN